MFSRKEDFRDPPNNPALPWLASPGYCIDISYKAHFVFSFFPQSTLYICGYLLCSHVKLPVHCEIWVTTGHSSLSWPQDLFWVNTHQLWDLSTTQCMKLYDKNTIFSHKIKINTHEFWEIHDQQSDWQCQFHLYASWLSSQKSDR